MIKRSTAVISDADFQSNAAPPRPKLLPRCDFRTIPRPLYKRDKQASPICDGSLRVVLIFCCGRAQGDFRAIVTRLLTRPPFTRLSKYVSVSSFAASRWLGSAAKRRRVILRSSIRVFAGCALSDRSILALCEREFPRGERVRRGRPAGGCYLRYLYVPRASPCL